MTFGSEPHVHSARTMSFNRVSLRIVVCAPLVGPRRAADAKSVGQTCSSAPLSTRIPAFRSLEALTANTQIESSFDQINKKKNLPITAHVSHSVLRMPLSREFIFFCSSRVKRPQQTNAVFQQGSPPWCQDPHGSGLPVIDHVQRVFKIFSFVRFSIWHATRKRVGGISPERLLDLTHRRKPLELLRPEIFVFLDFETQATWLLTDKSA